MENTTAINETMQAHALSAENAAQSDQAAAEKAAAFDALIADEYKTEFQNRLEAALSRRLKHARADADRLRAAEPLIDAVAARYGMDPENVAGLTEALAADQPAGDHPAAIAERLYRQQEELRRLYPEFRLGEEIENPLFKTLLESRVPLRTAYEVVHHRELIPAALRAAARAAESRALKRARENDARPVESAALPRGASPGGTDFSRLTPTERAALNRRAIHGETIRF